METKASGPPAKPGAGLPKAGTGEGGDGGDGADGGAGAGRGCVSMPYQGLRMRIWGFGNLWIWGLGDLGFGDLGIWGGGGACGGGTIQLVYATTMGTWKGLHMEKPPKHAEL